MDRTVNVDFEVIRLLTQVGLLASWAGLHEQAAQILRGARGWCPNVAQIRNCEALALFSASRRDEAVGLLTETIHEFPADEMAKAVLAVVLKQLDRPSWRLIAESVSHSRESYEAAWLARQTLGVDPAGTSAPSESRPALRSARSADT